MKNIKSLIIIFLAMVFAGQVIAQDKAITGNVKDDKGNALVGVAISAEGLAETLTDANGQFTIPAKVKGQLMFKALGYKKVVTNVAGLKANNQVVMVAEALFSGEDDMVDIPFAERTKRRITGSVNQIDVQKGLEQDQRTGLNAVLDGKVAGVFGGTNTWGTGNATIIVDGVPRDVDYLDMMEVESVTVLKDAVSKAMYGNLADNGVILVKTKRGNAYKKDLRFTAEYGVNSPRELPEYLGAADYMQAYNQAQLNDGVDPLSLRFSQDQIDGTIAGDNPAMYPDEDYYSDKYVKSQTNFVKVFGDVAGGNETTQYYANFGYKHNQGWMNSGTNDANDIMNMRGNVDFQITDNLKMNVDAVANFEFMQMPNVMTINNKGYSTSGFWDKIATTVPNAYPVLWDPNLVTDETEREFLLNNANLVDGMLLGGNNTIAQNSETYNLLGLLTQNGDRKQMNRAMQFNAGLDWDMDFITEGLSASAYATINFFNTSVRAQSGSFAMYEPVFGTDIEGNEFVSYVQHGVDESTSNYSTQEKEDYFSRRFGVYGNLKYDKTFGDHAISALGVLYRDEQKKAYDQEDKDHTNYFQDFVNYHYGVSANYAYKNKYIVDVAGVMVGSQKLHKDDRWGFAPAVGLGWVLSDEDFMDVDAIDYLKLRTSYGITKNDSWDDYYLYMNTFGKGGNYNYYNDQAQNAEINYLSVANDISLQARKEWTIGFDALTFNKSLKIEAGYFYSEAYDQMTKMNQTYPNIMGYNDLIYNNYNSTSNNGFELGLEFHKKLGEVDLTLGTNMVYRTSEITQKEEPLYASDAQQRYREGRQGDGIWGLTADGLYAESDFDSEGNLLSSLPQTTFGSVQAGDIKYVDINNDGVIDADDEDIIGNNNAHFQYSAYVDVKFKNFELYTMGIGQTGQDKLMKDDYFWVYGDLKYSEVVKDAYSPSNPDVNASYPRLSTTKNQNYRNSTYWLYDNDWFTLPVVQLSYNFGNLGTSFIKKAKLYVRATDVVVINKNKDKADVKVGQAPKVQSVAVGFVTTF